MSAGSDRCVTASDVEPLLDMATQGRDHRLRTEALTAAALLPLDATAVEDVGQLVLLLLGSEPHRTDGLIAAAGGLPVPEVRSVLAGWAADDTSPHQEAAERSLARAVPSQEPARADPPVPVAAGVAELSAAVADTLLASTGFPPELSALATLPPAEARGLLTRLVTTLVAAAEQDDVTLARAAERLGRVVQELPGVALTALPVLPPPVPERANWLGALVTLVSPGAVLAAVYQRLDAEDASGQLSALRQLVSVAPHLGRPPLTWPPPLGRGPYENLTSLLTTRDRELRGGPNRGGEPVPLPPSPLGWPAQPPPGPSDETREAYARLDAPRRVAPAEVFELRVGLAPTPSPEVFQPAPLTVSRGVFLLGVEILAPGFEVMGSEPLSFAMTAGPDDPYPYQLRRMRAMDDGAYAGERVITAVFSVGGRVIGVAHRTVRVGEGPEDVPPAQVPEEPAGVTWALPDDDPGTRPDLEIVVAPANDAGGTQLCWLYRSPHPEVRPPGKPPVTRLGGEAEWARNVMRGVQDHKEAVDLGTHLHGIGLEVREAMPDEVWAALRAAARVTNPPTVLIATWDPYVPWELAVVPRPWGAGIPGYLGAQAVVGRWTYGDQQRTAAPPARLTARAMAVVSGDYHSNELRHATAEAEHLVAEYRAEAVDALVEPVLGSLRAGAGHDILHFAVHGKFDAADSEDGINMTDGRYLSRYSVRGVETSPVRLVFLNACQLGQGRSVLGSNAGMVPAFLSLGVGAVVAPLWNVDDEVAREFAEGFYRAALKGGAAPAEYVRQQRAATGGAAGAGLSTPLAYLFFGHPRLTIVWDREGAQGV
ncbi:CHAT domain-containing protein [Streptomyces sp. 147326]|uniref:CHAT domain-containing protein n=1 Tax=Streptomyces sp. 147326 TaxID=3074379 RepID=UPI0038574512